MKIFLALVISVLASSVFAQVDNIQVNVNGRIYQCSGDNGGVDQAELHCRKATEASTSKYQACISAGNYKPDCFNSAFGKKVNSCVLWSEACNKTCISAGNYKPDCYNSCY